MAAALPVVLVTTCLGVFLAQLDTSVVNLALKHVGAELGSSITQLQWIVDGYNLAYGVLADRRNARRHLRPPPLVHDRRRSFYGWIADLRDRSRQCDNDRRPDADRTWCRIRDADIARDLVRCLSGCGTASARHRRVGELQWSRVGRWTDYGRRHRRSYRLALDFSSRGSHWIAGERALPGRRSEVALPKRPQRRRARPNTRCVDAGNAVGCLHRGSSLGVEQPRYDRLLGSRRMHVCFLRHRGNTHGAPVAAADDLSLARGLRRFGRGGRHDVRHVRYAVPDALVPASGPRRIGCRRRVADATGVACLLPGFVEVRKARHTIRCASDHDVRIGADGTRATRSLTLSRTADIVLIECAFLSIGVGLGFNTGPLLSVAVSAAPKAHAGAAAGVVNTARMIGATLGVAVLGGIFAAYAGQTPVDP